MALTSTSDRAFVWVWLPGQTTPVPAGVLTNQSGSGLWFHYGNEYLNPGTLHRLWAYPTAYRGATESADPKYGRLVSTPRTRARVCCLPAPRLRSHCPLNLHQTRLFAYVGHYVS